MSPFAQNYRLSEDTMSVVRASLYADQPEYGEKVIMERQADPGDRSLRRLIMAQMKKSGSTISQIARHYRYSPRHVKRELAEWRKQREQDSADRRAS